MIVPRFIRRLFRAPYDGLQHFGVVEEGKLYRCGQPTPDELDALITKHGLKTVIALRGSRNPDDPDSWEQEERAVCDQHGVEFITLPCNHKNPPTPQQFQRFLEVMNDESHRPALVHCRIGQQRTGIFCALYRVKIQDTDPQSALKEMDDLGFNIRHRRHKKLLEAYLNFSEAQTLS